MRAASALIGALGAVHLLTRYAIRTVRREMAQAQTRAPWPVSVPTPNKKGTRP